MKPAQDGMNIQVFTYGVPLGDRNDMNLFLQANPTYSQYYGLDLSPTFPSSPPRNRFWATFKTMLKSMGSSMLSNIFNKNPIIIPGYLSQLEQNLATAADNGQFIISPIGDQNSDSLMPDLMPAGMDQYVITVGGAKMLNNIPEYWPDSRVSPYVDVSAEAQNIFSISGKGYSAYDTSFSSTAASAGIVAGVVSLLHSAAPSLTHDDMEQILERTARDMGTPGKDNQTGYGFVDAEAALDYIQNNTITHATATNSTINLGSPVSVNPETVKLGPGYGYDSFIHAGFVHYACRVFKKDIRFA